MNYHAQWKGCQTSTAPSGKGRRMSPPIRSQLLFKQEKRNFEGRCGAVGNSAVCDFHDPRSIFSRSNDVKWGQTCHMRVYFELTRR